MQQVEWSTDGQPARTISEWCLEMRISAPTFHKWDKAGKGPVVRRVGNVVRIVEGTQSYHRRMLALAEQEAAQRELQRRREQAAVAGKIAAKSPRHISRRKRTA